MKMAVSILMATLVLMTGLHLSFDSHFCEGKLAAVNFSLTGQKASCGMEDESDSPLPAGKLFKKHCCDDDLSTLTVDSNYDLSGSKFHDFNQKVIPFFALPLTVINGSFAIYANDSAVLSSEAVFRRNGVDLAAICVFRI